MLVELFLYIMVVGLIYVVCLCHCLMIHKVVRRWVNEVQEGVTSQHEMVQYHALSLLYQIKAHDRLAVSKMVRFRI